jgi:hypothetical protein
VVAVAHFILALLEQAGLEAVAMDWAVEALLEQIPLALPTLVVEAVVFLVQVQHHLLAAPELSSCHTTRQKAQPFNSCLLQHGKHP